MKGNQGYRGGSSGSAHKKAGPKKGSGGKHRRALAGRGPTPKAEERTYHPAYAKKAEREAKQAQEAARAQSAPKSSIRIASDSELVVGRNSVVEAARSGIQIKKIYISVDPGQGRMKEVLEVLAETGAPFVEVTKRDLDRVSDGASHQGIAVEVSEYKYWNLDELLTRAQEKVQPGLLVALDHVTDPHNVGAVLRGSAAFGADGLLLPDRRSAGINVVAWKVSAGAAAHVPVAQVGNLVQALNKCKEAGFFIVGLDGDAHTTVRGLELSTAPIVLVTGAEGAGLSRLVRQTCDLIVSIPTTDKVESLNAAVATSIALYEIHMTRVLSQTD